MRVVFRAMRVGRNIFDAASGELKWLFGRDRPAPDQSGIRSYRLDKFTVIADPSMTIIPCAFDAVGTRNSSLKPVNRGANRLAIGEREQRADRVATGVVEITHLDQ